MSAVAAALVLSGAPDAWIEHSAMRAICWSDRANCARHSSYSYSRLQPKSRGSFNLYDSGVGPLSPAAESGSSSTWTHIAIEAELVPLRNTVVIPYITGAFGPDGEPVDDRARAAAKIMLDDLAWWAEALRRARMDGPLPPAIMRRTATGGAH
jgi:hypothetical protein